ncbi:DUF6160 family protein [Acinetobacter sp. 3657]|uniref:DUF6160 family protein n=1 Tax=Acinetobacter sp. 3657 TaxID=2817764 RepID=UPI002866070D|nr:hypothetical protein [Prolinoborus sp. 3657]
MKYNNEKRQFVLNTLAFSLLLIQTSAYAMQALDDTALRGVNGQDGIHVSTIYDEVNVEQFYWEDNAGRGSNAATNNTLRAVANGFKIKQSNASNLGLGTDYKINIGSTTGVAGKTGLELELATNPSLITIDSFAICDTEATQRCSDPVGNLAVQTSSVIGIQFKTRDGLFSKTSQSILDLGLRNANIYLGQTNVNNQLNQLILKNLNFNFLGKGVMFVDGVEGFRLQTNTKNSDGSEPTPASLSQSPNANYGYVDFRRTADSASSTLSNTGSYGNGLAGSNGVTTNSGLNLEFMLNGDVSQVNPYAIDTSTNSPTGAKGLIRVGASGRMVNGFLQLRGLDSSGRSNPEITRNPANLLDPNTNKYGNPDGTNILGQANSHTTNSTNNIMGNSGLAFRMKAEFTRENDSMLAANSANNDSAGAATTLEIGGAGLNTYGFEFGNLTGLQQGSRGSFDSGNVYINLADTKTALLPANYTFQTSRFGNGSFLTNPSDYSQNIHMLMTDTNPYSLLIAVRGGEFQALSRRGRFTNSARTNDTFGSAVPNINEHMNNEWGLALPFYNLNANIAMLGTRVNANEVYYYSINGTRTAVAASGTTPRLGFSLAMSTEGIDKDFSRSTSSTAYQQKGFNVGNKTTSILVIDGGDKDPLTAGVQPTDYYMGLRNIDMLLKGTGSVGVENGSFNVSLKDMLIVMAAEVAAGYLPGATYRSCVGASPLAGCSTQNAALADNFARKDDVLFGLKLRLGGDIDFSLIPNSEYKADGSGNRINIVGNLELKGTGNTVQISDPIDGSTIGLDNLTGKIGFNNAIVIGRHTSGEGVVSFNAGLTFNPDRTTDGVFRARDINFYPPLNIGTEGKRLGELAITGGRLNSNFSMIPRNGNFTN